LSEIQNPQNQPGIDKNVMIIFAVVMVLLVLAQQFFVKPQQQASQQKQAAQTATAPAAAAAQAPTVAATPAETAPVAAVKAESEQTTVVENALYRITFTNRGGLVKSWVLKKYNDDSGHPLELVNAAAAQQYGYPLSLWSWDEQLREKVNGALYATSSSGGSSPTDLSFW